MVAIGIVAGIFVIALLYAVSMLAYFSFRRKFAGAKYAVELITGLSAIVVSVGVKLAVLLLSTEHSFSEGFASVLIAIYSGIGGLTFEGISSVSELGAFLNCLYAGTSLYAGLIALSVITARASYEIYCGILLFFMRGSLRSGTDLFVFTSVTEDSVQLAGSVKEKYAQKGKKCVILFTGDSLGVFDRTSPLHREIMSRGYLYWEYSKSKKEGREPSVLKRMHLYTRNDITDRTRPAKDVRIRMFAFGLSGELTGSESSNSDIVFGEMRAMTREIAERKAPRCIVDFYILTESEINYGFYANQTEKVVRETLALCKAPAVGAEVFSKLFQLHVVSEASLSARCLVQRRNDLFSRDGGDLFREDNDAGARNVYRAIVLGFGKTGQESMKTVFTDTAYVNGAGEASQFVADVYDSRMEELAGLFSVSHPLYFCATRMEEIRPFEEEEFLKNARPCIDKTERFYRPLLESRGKGETFEEVMREMKFPRITFHKASCFQTKFMRFLDDESGISQKNKLFCNAFIIALGNDEANLKMANAIIDDLKHESGISGGKSLVYPQMIYVNLRDGKNYDRVNWTDEDEKTFTSFKVILFGCKEEMYSYDSIVDDASEMDYHFAYSSLYDEDLLPEAYRLFGLIRESVDEKNADRSYLEEICKIKASIAAMQGRCSEIRKKWLEVPIFDKQSNYAANRFSAYLAREMRGEVTGETLARLARLEHVRWCRFYMSCGWTYAKYGKEEKKARRRIREHQYLCPFSMLDKDTQANDLVNVTLAYDREQSLGGENCKKQDA